MKKKIWILMAMVGLLFTNRVYASLYISHEITSFPIENLAVISTDGSNYTKNVSAQSTLSAVIHVDMDAGLLGEIHSWSTWLRTNPTALPGGNVVDHLSGAFVRTYVGGGLNYINEVDLDVGVTADYSSLAVDNCNTLADDLRNQGYTNGEIFSEDHTIIINVTPEFSYSANYNGDLTSEVSATRTVELVCKAFEVNDDGPEHNPAPAKAHLISVGLNMLHEEEPTDCPTEVTAIAVFYSNAPGQFTFRFRSIFGQVSDPVLLTMDALDLNPGTGLYMKIYQQPFMAVEKSAPFVVEGGDGLVGMNHGSDLIDAGKIPGGEEPANIDGKIVDGADANEHWDTFWIEVIDAAPGSDDTSNFDSYNVICNPKVNPGFEPVGEFGVEFENEEENTRGETSGTLTSLH